MPTNRNQPEMLGATSGVTTANLAQLGKTPQQNDTPMLRSWRASLFRKRGSQFLGHVNAPDREAAKIAAVERFKLDDEQRRRLVLQERA